MSIYDIQLTTIDGASIGLGAYRGQLLLVVNVASRCGFTPQYAGLETLYRSHKDRGLVVLGFPCNQFGRQEPGDEAQIKRFCAEQYGVTFPLFSTVDVNGPGAHPLCRYLKSRKRGMLGFERIGWNFIKCLVSREGEVLRRYGSRVKPEMIAGDLVQWM